MNAKKRYCKFCGGLIDNDTKKCSSCGKQYFRMPKLRVNALLAILCVILVGLNIFQYYKISAIQSDFEYKINARDSTISELRSNVAKYKPRAEFMDKHIAFVVNKEGNVYHTYDCQYFKEAESFWAYNVNQAENLGYRPCKKCIS